MGGGHRGDRGSLPVRRLPSRRHREVSFFFGCKDCHVWTDSLTTFNMRGMTEGEKGFTSIKADAVGVPAAQPVLAGPKDEECLTGLRTAMHAYLLKHLEALDERNAG